MQMQVALKGMEDDTLIGLSHVMFKCPFEPGTLLCTQLSAIKLAKVDFDTH